MGRQVVITCDGCGGDVAHEGERTRSRLHLEDERIPAKDLMAHKPEPPILDCSKYFCSIGCLRVWVEDNNA